MPLLLVPCAADAFGPTPCVARCDIIKVVVRLPDTYPSTLCATLCGKRQISAGHMHETSTLILPQGARTPASEGTWLGRSLPCCHSSQEAKQGQHTRKQSS